MSIMREVIFALLTGIIVGFIFALLNLPIPAPPALAGVTGIVGVYLGYKLFLAVAPMFTKGG
jgi:XapX domain-containing protein